MTFTALCTASERSFAVGDGSHDRLVYKRSIKACSTPHRAVPPSTRTNMRGVTGTVMHRSENEVVPRMVCGENQGYARAARRVRHSLNLNMNLNSGSELDSGRDRRGAAPRARALLLIFPISFSIAPPRGGRAPRLSESQSVSQFPLSVSRIGSGNGRRRAGGRMQCLDSQTTIEKRRPSRSCIFIFDLAATHPDIDMWDWEAQPEAHAMCCRTTRGGGITLTCDGSHEWLTIMASWILHSLTLFSTQPCALNGLSHLSMRLVPCDAFHVTLGRAWNIRLGRASRASKALGQPASGA